jgi:hypothetical protein
MERAAYDRCMRCWPAVALAVALLGLGGRVSAQRGGSHGGGAVHGSTGGRGFSAGPAAQSFRGYAAQPAYQGGRPTYAAPGYARPNVSSAARAVARPAFYGNRNGVRVVGRGYPGYGLGYGLGYGVGYPYGLGWVYPWSDGYDDRGLYAGSGDGVGPSADVYPDGVMPPPPPEQAQAAAVHPPYLAPEDAVTLLFKDGRPQLKIHNYVLTRTTLYVTDGRHRDIPVADIDLAATQKVNADAGVDFQMPK